MNETGEEKRLKKQPPQILSDTAMRWENHSSKGGVQGGRKSAGDKKKGKGEFATYKIEKDQIP